MKKVLKVVLFMGCYCWGVARGCRDGWYDATIVETGNSSLKLNKNYCNIRDRY